MRWVLSISESRYRENESTAMAKLLASAFSYSATASLAHPCLYPSNASTALLTSRRHSPSCGLVVQRHYQYQSRRKMIITCSSANHESSHCLYEKLKDLVVSNLKSNVPIRSYCTEILGKVFAVVLIIFQAAVPFPLKDIENWLIPPANAVLYSPDTKVPRTGEVALRKAIPANPAMKQIQGSLENILYLLRIPQRKPYGTMEGDVTKALQIAIDERDSILGTIPLDNKEDGLKLYDFLLNGQGGLEALIESIKSKDPNIISIKLSSSLDTVAQLELLQAPGLPYLLPEQYQQYPRLNGRATVEFIVEREDGSMFSVAAGGGPQKSATIQVVLDGYSAPLTAGNFAKLVIDGQYDGVKLKCTEQAIIAETEHGDAGISLPIEILPAGGFEPLYRTTLSVQDGELPVLPLSVYGAIAMAHNPVSENYSAPSQFFFYLYDKRYAGLGGLSFDEGQFSVFGYTINGREILPQLKTGDVIKSAKLVEGSERLVLPSSNT